MYDEKFVSVTILCIEFVECEFCATSIILNERKNSAISMEIIEYH